MRAALTGKSASVDIPTTRDEGGGSFTGSKTFAAVLGRSVLSGSNNSMLPTPPNSISPSLPPHYLRDRSAKQISAGSTIPSVESDLDLGSSGFDSKSEDCHKFNGSSTDDESFGLTTAKLELAGAITPRLLAKHHLPDILIDHGPLAIRYLMGHLTSSVPGFSRIPPAKARRLVVGALEGQSEDDSELPLNPDIVFEKVGWGKWDARRVGQPRRECLTVAQDTIPENTASTTPSLLIHLDSSTHEAGSPFASGNSRKLGLGGRHHLSTIDRVRSSDCEGHHDQDFDSLENEADKMSLDGDHATSSSDAAQIERLDVPMGDNPEDVTDDEDWRSIGAEALRKSSLPAGGGFRRNYFALRTSSSRHRGASSHSRYEVARSAPTLIKRTRTPDLRRKLSAVDVGHSERAAIEALLSMSSR